MKIFISWSGTQSRAIAEAFRVLIGDVIQACEPFLSEHGIESGQKWALRLDDELAGTSVGVICLTPQNRHAPWIHYEAGALAKNVTTNERGCVCLHGLSKAEVEFPLAQFQMDTLDRGGVWNIIQSLNAVMEEGSLDEPRLVRAFDRGWEDFQGAITKLPDDGVKAQEHRDQREILEEILQLVRGGAKRRAQMPLEIVGGWSRSPLGMAAAMKSIQETLDNGGPVGAKTALTTWVKTYSPYVATGVIDNVHELIDMLNSPVPRVGAARDEHERTIRDRIGVLSQHILSQEAVVVDQYSPGG